MIASHRAKPALAAIGLFTALLAGCGAPAAAAPAPVEPSAAPTRTATVAPTPTATGTATPAATATITPTPAPSDPNAGISFTQQAEPGQEEVAITIDDFTYTDVIRYWLIDYVANNPDVKITAFPVGYRVPEIEQQFPGFWRRWLDAGNEIGYHTMQHKHVNLMSPDELRADIDAFNATVGAAIGDPSFRVRWARAPGGEYNGAKQMLDEIAQEYDLTWVLWNSVPSSAKYVGHLYGMQYPDAIVDGDIALFHIRWQDQYWLERYVEECRTRGVKMVTLSQTQLIPDTQAESSAQGEP
jgi:peptidoglycan/xylan/chitin deacetylase (PgdA/CDA1 family)